MTLNLNNKQNFRKKTLNLRRTGLLISKNSLSLTRINSQRRIWLLIPIYLSNRKFGELNHWEFKLMLIQGFCYCPSHHPKEWSHWLILDIMLKRIRTYSITEWNALLIPDQRNDLRLWLKKNKELRIKEESSSSSCRSEKQDFSRQCSLEDWGSSTSWSIRDGVLNLYTVHRYTIKH